MSELFRPAVVLDRFPVAFMQWVLSWLDQAFGAESAESVDVEVLAVGAHVASFVHPVLLNDFVGQALLVHRDGRHVPQSSLLQVSLPVQASQIIVRIATFEGYLLCALLP